MRKRITPLTTEELAKFQTLSTSHPTLRERLFLALDPATDNVPNGVRVALAICEKYPDESRSLENLTLAFAVVWDEAQVVAHEMIRVIPELQKSQAKPCPYLDSFGWYVQHKEKFYPQFACMPWRLQVYLASEGIALGERDYVLANFKFSPSIGTIYSKIPYDSSKLKDNVGRLGKSPYTLENLTQFGGLHRDQAFFASSVCHAFGVPAYMASGRSLMAGEQAWVGWIIDERKGYKLLSHGRNPADPHFTTTIADPASGNQIDEYRVAIDAKGLSDEETYREADLRYRIWFEIGEKLEPPARFRLLTTAVKRNAYHHAAWQAIGDAAASGALPANSANEQWRNLCKSFMAYPGLIYQLADRFSRMHEAAADKYRFYEQTAGIFKRLRRQDLLGQLRFQQIQMCEEAKRKDMAAQVALTGLQESGGKGAQGFNLANKAIALMPNLQKPEAVIQVLKTIESKIPSRKSGRTNPEWLEYAMLLAKAYKQAGNFKAVERLENKMFSIQAKDK